MTTINLEAIAPKPQPKLREYPLAGAAPAAPAYVGTRQVYHQDAWLPFAVYTMVELRPGNVIVGPAIIRDPMTTVVIPPAKEMWIDAFMILHYRAQKDTA